MFIKYIKIYGERNSGLLELAKNLNKNLIDIEILSGNYKKGWQHGEPLFNFNKPQYSTLFICLVRNLDEWLTMMFQKPYHINTSNDFNYFINNNIVNIEKDKLDHDTNINNFEKNKNIFQLRYDKYDKYKKLLKFNNCILLNINNFLKDQDKLYNILNDEFNIKHQSKLNLLNNNFLLVNNILSYNTEYKNEKLENEINTLTIEYNHYTDTNNEYCEKIRKLILSKPELIINYGNKFPEIIFISNSEDINKDILEKYKDKSIMKFLGYYNFENIYETTIFSQIGIKFIDFIKYISLYYDFTPLIIFNCLSNKKSKLNLINNHIKNKCYITNCCFCNTSNNSYLNILESFINNDKYLSDCNLKINKMMNENINNTNKLQEILNLKLDTIQLNKIIKLHHFNLLVTNDKKDINIENKYKYFLGIITRCKNEKYIDEFVKHYTNEGVDKIIIIDDDSIDKEIYNTVKDKKNVEIIYEKDIIQKNIANSVYHNIRYNFKWMMFVDIDEFITTVKNKNKTLRQELLDTYHNHICIKVPWVLMAFNKQERYPQSLLENITYRMNYDINHTNRSDSFKFRNRDSNIDVKCIFKTKYFSDISLKNNRSHDHFPVMDNNFKNVSLIESLTNNVSSYSPKIKNVTEEKLLNSYLLCYHYRINSLEHARDKIKNNMWYNKIKLEDIINFDFPDIKDELLKNKSIERN